MSAFQTTRLVRTSCELVQLNPASLERIFSIEYFRYRIKIPPSISARFDDDLFQAYRHAEELFRAKYVFSALHQFDNEFNIVSPVEIDEPILYSFGKSGNAEKLEITRLDEKLQLDLSNQRHLQTFFRFFYQSLRNSLSKRGFDVEGGGSFDKKVDLLGEVHHHSKNEQFGKIQKFVHLHPAFSFRLRKFDDSFFIQISPRSVLRFERDLYSLNSEGFFSANEFTKIFESVSLPIGRTAKLYSLLDKTVQDPITEKPFCGDSFKEVATRLYPYLAFTKDDANLLLALPYGNATTPWYFSTELTRPSLRFSDIAAWDYDFYSDLLSEMKLHSSTRKELIEQFLKDAKFEFLNSQLEVSDLVSYEAAIETLNPSEFQLSPNASVFVFPNPWMSFKDKRTGRVVSVNRVTGHLGATVDLLAHEELTCFHSPAEVKVKILSQDDLYADACRLVEAIDNGVGDYRGFENTFTSKLVYGEIVPVKDLSTSTDAYSDIAPENYDCVLVFGPRRLPEGFEKSKMVYTFPETEILNRGVPVQFIANEPAANKLYDRSFARKSSDAHAVFGMGLNVLGKIGAKIMILGPETTNYFLPNSVVIGYNIARIFEPLKKDVSQEENPGKLIRNSTPLAAPVVMMSQDGAEIVLQDAYQLTNEASLFREGRAERMIDELSGSYKNFVIHKDGRFYYEELSDIRKIQRSNRVVIPVSIVSDHSPRLFSSVASWNRIPKAGTIVELSDNDFLMATPLTTGAYEPKYRGWPNTILVTIHEEALDSKLTPVRKMQILYQIWALTRVHMGSQLPTRKPISVHYSNSMATFLRKVGNPRPRYFANFGRQPNRLGYISKIFL